MKDSHLWPILAMVVFIDAAIVVMAFAFPIFCYVLVGFVVAGLALLRFYPK